MYELMYLLGAIAAILTVAFRFKTYSAPPFRAISAETIVVVIAVCSGKVLFGIEELIYGRDFSLSGIRIFGLIFSVPIMCFILYKFVKINWINLLSLCTPGLAISSVFARIGCHFAGCCGGPPITIGGVTVEISEQLVECMFDFVIFVILLALERRSKSLLYPVYLFLYGIVRFFLDFFRDSPSVLFGLTVAQLISVCSIIGALIWLICAIKQKDAIDNREQGIKKGE